MLLDPRAERQVVLAEHVHDLLGLGGLREGREAAHVAEDDDDLAAVAGQQALVIDHDVRQLG